MKIKKTTEILKQYAVQTNGNLQLRDISVVPSKSVNDCEWVSVDDISNYLDNMRFSDKNPWGQIADLLIELNGLESRKSLALPVMEHNKDKYFGKKIIVMDESPEFLSKGHSETFKKKASEAFKQLMRTQRLNQKRQFQQAPFPFNMMASCIDDKGDIRKWK